MADHVVSDTRLYKVLDNGTVRLTVTVGDRQVGDTTCQIGDREVEGARDTDGREVFGMDDGSGVRNKLLKCTTVVKDINPLSDRTSVTYELEGGASAEVATYEHPADPGGRVVYLLTFALV